MRAEALHVPAAGAAPVAAAPAAQGGRRLGALYRWAGAFIRPEWPALVAVLLLSLLAVLAGLAAAVNRGQPIEEGLRLGFAAAVAIWMSSCTTSRSKNCGGHDLTRSSTSSASAATERLWAASMISSGVALVLTAISAGCSDVTPCSLNAV